MKKLFILLAIIISILVINKDDKIIIPSSSIRLRVIASSSSLKDQTTKNKVSIKLIDYINELTSNLNSKEEVTSSLLDNYSSIKEIVNEYEPNNNISIGKNKFPKKEYKGVVYEAGNYDSIVVSLGNSSGINWWCCIYPPLCNINETKDIKYTTLVSEILDKYKE